MQLHTVDMTGFALSAVKGVAAGAQSLGLVAGSVIAGGYAGCEAYKAYKRFFQNQVDPLNRDEIVAKIAGINVGAILSTSYVFTKYFSASMAAQVIGGYYGLVVFPLAGYAYYEKQRREQQIQNGINIVQNQPEVLHVTPPR